MPAMPPLVPISGRFQSSVNGQNHFLLQLICGPEGICFTKHFTKHSKWFIINMRLQVQDPSLVRPVRTLCVLQSEALKPCPPSLRILRSTREDTRCRSMFFLTMFIGWCAKRNGKRSSAAARLTSKHCEHHHFRASPLTIPFDRSFDRSLFDRLTALSTFEKFLLKILTQASDPLHFNPVPRSILISWPIAELFEHWELFSYFNNHTLIRSLIRARILGHQREVDWTQIWKFPIFKSWEFNERISNWYYQSYH